MWIFLLWGLLTALLVGWDWRIQLAMLIPGSWLELEKRNDLLKLLFSTLGQFPIDGARTGRSILWRQYLPFLIDSTRIASHRWFLYSSHLLRLLLTGCSRWSLLLLLLLLLLDGHSGRRKTKIDPDSDPSCFLTWQLQQDNSRVSGARPRILDCH